MASSMMPDEVSRTESGETGRLRDEGRSGERRSGQRERQNRLGVRGVDEWLRGPPHERLRSAGAWSLHPGPRSP